MKMTKLAAPALVFFWAIGISAGPAVAQPAQKAPDKEENKNLIRMDLLRVKRSELSVPKRNIFSPQTSQRSPLPGVHADLSNPSGAGQEQPQDEAGEAPQALTVNLRYIGYVLSPRKMIGLVILEGQAMAVVEGEVVSEGVRIGKITAQEIEIILPDSTTRTFSLEGEEG
jgi:hypothetical protein